MVEGIGNISVVKLNERTTAADIGYCMGKAWWGKEIMPEALKSGRVMDKAGMKMEGVLRVAGINNQGVCDEVWHSILKEELKDKIETL